MSWECVYEGGGKTNTINSSQSDETIKVVTMKISDGTMYESWIYKQSKKNSRQNQIFDTFWRLIRISGDNPSFEVSSNQKNCLPFYLPSTILISSSVKSQSLQTRALISLSVAAICVWISWRDFFVSSKTSSHSSFVFGVSFCFSSFMKPSKSRLQNVSSFVLIFSSANVCFTTLRKFGDFFCNNQFITILVKDRKKTKKSIQ